MQQKENLEERINSENWTYGGGGLEVGNLK